MPQLSYLVKAAGDRQMAGKISFCPPARWVFQPDYHDLLIQIEPGIADSQLILNTTLARDGSGPLLASFMSTLFIEESHATSPSGLGVCSGSVSVTFFICRSVNGMQPDGFVQLLENFVQLVSWTADDLLPAGPALLPSQPVAGDSPDQS